MVNILSNRDAIINLSVIENRLINSQKFEMLRPPSFFSK